MVHQKSTRYLRSLSWSLFMLYAIYHVFVCFHLHLFALPISMKAHLINNMFSKRAYSFQLIYMLLMLASYSIWRVDWCILFVPFGWPSMILFNVDLPFFLITVNQASALHCWWCLCAKGKPFLSQHCALQCWEKENTECAFPPPSGDGSAVIFLTPANPRNPWECTQGAPQNRDKTLGPYSQFCIFPNFCTRL